MVDMTTLGRINQLLGEYHGMERAIRAFDAGERIRSMTVGGNTVSTIDWDYPAPMIEGIKQILRSREGMVERSLRDLGFTGDLSEPDDEPDREIAPGEGPPPEDHPAARSRRK